MIGLAFLRITEIVFASYMVPALMVPIAWLLAWTQRRRLGRKMPAAAEVERQWRVLRILFLIWFALFLVVFAGVRLNRSGVIAIVMCWSRYALTNFSLAWFLLPFTATYGSIPPGPVADRAYLRFLGIVVAQPLMTAAAFAVLNQVMGVAWNLQAGPAGDSGGDLNGHHVLHVLQCVPHVDFARALVEFALARGLALPAAQRRRPRRDGRRWHQRCAGACHGGRRHRVRPRRRTSHVKPPM
jgi:hypothetical protein